MTPGQTSVLSIATLACALGLGCSAKKRACEHARDVQVEVEKQEMQHALAEMPADMQAHARAGGEDVIAKVQDRFVGMCVDADEQTTACIDRIDELKAARDVLREQVQRCFAAGEPELDGCLSDAYKPFKKLDIAACEGPINALLHKVYED